MEIIEINFKEEYKKKLINDAKKFEEYVKNFEKVNDVSDVWTLVHYGIIRKKNAKANEESEMKNFKGKIEVNDNKVMKMEIIYDDKTYELNGSIETSEQIDTNQVIINMFNGLKDIDSDCFEIRFKEKEDGIYKYDYQYNSERKYVMMYIYCIMVKTHIQILIPLRLKNN